jgi:hypothetical protein
MDSKTNVSTLEIDEATLEDSGEYTVTAENAQGASSCSVSVSVTTEQTAPEFSDIPKPVLTKEGERFEIKCSVKGN